ncbi:MAG: hypothetical protein PHW40_04845 [Candidatus Izemoplasmatales bacterium]|nr:hypothetical protein [Candidatus Izemoplasmatales bacterium]
MNLSLKMAENRIIADLVTAFDFEDFNKLMGIRQKRLRLWPYEVSYEMAVEQIEGTANYVELEALRQLNVDKYETKLHHMKQSIVHLGNLIPIRIISYDVGALIIKIMRDNGLILNHDFNDRSYLDYYLNSMVSEQVHEDESNEIHDLINQYYRDISQTLETSVKEENLVFKGDYPLLGVNIYNAKYSNQYIITEYFLMYQEEAQAKILNGHFVIKLNEKHHISEVYKLQ